MNRFLVGLIDTIIVIISVPIFGFIINKIVNGILKFLVKHFGVWVTNFIANRITFIGTVHHELSHALLAFITGAKITKIDLFYPQGNTLGRVEFKTRGGKLIQSLQLTMSAIAPVLLGACTEYLLIYYGLANCNIIWLKVIICYLIISILFHMTMSKQDVYSAVKGLPIVSILLFVIFSILNINIIQLVQNTVLALIN
jgi:hypothetical protein